MSTVEDLLLEATARKLWVSNLYQGTDSIWRCFLRDKRNGLPHTNRGAGKTMAAALRAALTPTFEDLL